MVKCLPGKHKSLSLDPRTMQKAGTSSSFLQPGHWGNYEEEEPCSSLASQLKEISKIQVHPDTPSQITRWKETGKTLVSQPWGPKFWSPESTWVSGRCGGPAAIWDGHRGSPEQAGWRDTLCSSERLCLPHKTESSVEITWCQSLASTRTLAHTQAHPHTWAMHTSLTHVHTKYFRWLGIDHWDGSVAWSRPWVQFLASRGGESIFIKRTDIL